MHHYPINSIFKSFDGEVNKWGQGVVTTFIRFQGCNLKCRNCDTKYSLEINPDTMLLTYPEIISEVMKFNTQKVTITGGEPLLQDISKLVEELLLLGYKISIETNGSIKLDQCWINDKNVSIIMDYKLHSSHCNLSQEELQSVLTYNMEHLDRYDQHYLKFLISEQEDIEKAFKIMEPLPTSLNIAFSPVFYQSGAGNSFILKEITEKLIQYKTNHNCMLNIQIHKLIGVK
jgi:7-carboxy-7-deazaguanine synthase